MEREPMEGLEPATAERREPVRAQVFIDPSPTKLRNTLALVDDLLVAVEPGVRRRVQLLLGEVIGRSSVGTGRFPQPIQIEIDILPSTIRIQVSGPALAMPSHSGESEHSTRPSYPHWILSGLADRWGQDRRGSDFGLWFLLQRESW
jgi:hypothetical protein